MRLDKNDPRLIDFVLGELEESKARSVSEALQAPENAEALREVEALQETVRASTAALKAEPEAAGLGEAQRKKIFAAADQPAAKRNVVRFPWKSLLAAAAVVIVIGGVALPMLGRAREAARRGSPENAAKVARLEAELASQVADTAAQPAAEAPAPPIVDDARYGLNEERLSELKKESSVSATAGVDLNNAPPAEAPKQAPEVYQSYIQQPSSTAPAAPPVASRAPFLGDAPAAGAAGAGGGFGGGGFGAQPKAEAKPGAVSQSSLEGVTVGGEIRARGNYYSDAAVNQPAPEVAADGDQDGLRALGYLDQEVQPSPPPPHWQWQGGEAYAPIVENDFARVADAPLSTFSIDVDTAAYSNVRRFLTQGTLPPPNSVRLEEMINYFDYRYPQPEGEDPFSVNVEVGACPWEPEHLIARIGLQGLDVPRDKRPPANLVFLLDVSGSMSDANKLPLVKESMKALLRELDEGDKVGIVTYASGSSIPLRSTSAANEAEILAAIDSLEAGGSTHGSAGIQDAYTMAMNNFMADGVNRVILATDGDFNVGVTSPDALVKMIEEKRKSGVFLTALGFGMGNIKDATLEQLADKGNGNYAYIDSFAEARKVLVDELMGTLVTIAKDVKIQVEFNPGQVQAYRLLGYENRALAARDFNDDTKDAGEIGSGHQVTALYQIVPVGSRIQPGVDALRYQDQPEPETAAEPSGELMNVKLRYKKPDSDTSQKIETPVVAEGKPADQLSPDTKFAASVAAFGMLLRHSQYAGKATFDQVRELAEQGAQAGWFDGPKAQEMKQAREDFVNLVVTAKTLGSTGF